MGLGIGGGDEVIVPSHSFIASASCILLAGATAVFCDSRTSPIGSARPLRFSLSVRDDSKGFERIQSTNALSYTICRY
jgi:hypothetical protein